jgi:hypothetical protein
VEDLREVDSDFKRAQQESDASLAGALASVDAIVRMPCRTFLPIVTFLSARHDFDLAVSSLPNRYMRFALDVCLRLLTLRLGTADGGP